LQRDKYLGKPCFYVEVLPQSIPVDLRIIRDDDPPGHHVIAPARDMTLASFRAALNSLAVSPVQFRAAADPEWDKYHPDEFRNLQPSMQTLAAVLYPCLHHEILDDFEQDLVATLIGRLRKRELANLKELKPWETGFIANLVSAYITKEELESNSDDFEDVEILDDFLAPYRGLYSQLKS